MEKVKLTKEQAENLEKLKEFYKDSDTMVVQYLNDSVENVWESGRLSGCNAQLEITLDELIRALYVGYEVEKTPEEQIKTLWDSYNPKVSNDDYDRGIRNGIETILDLLNIKIEGVNS